MYRRILDASSPRFQIKRKSLPDPQVIPSGERHDCVSTNSSRGIGSKGAADKSTANAVPEPPGNLPDFLAKDTADQDGMQASEPDHLDIAIRHVKDIAALVSQHVR